MTPNMKQVLWRAEMFGLGCAVGCWVSAIIVAKTGDLALAVFAGLMFFAWALFTRCRRQDG